MGKMTMGPASEKKKQSKMAIPEPQVIEKIVEVEKVVEKEVPVYIEKQITKEIPVEKIIHSDNSEEMGEFKSALFSTSSRISDLEIRVDSIPDCSEKHKDALSRLEAIEQSIDIHDKTIVHIRELQASADELYKQLNHQLNKSEKYNKYYMIAIGISILLSVIATIL